MNILLVYASNHGCAEKCAEMVAKELSGNTNLVNLKKSGDVDISGYDKVIIGGSIYAGRIQKEVSAFCTKNLEQLKQKKIGLFFCGMQGADTADTVISQNFPSELVEKADVKSYFGGEFQFSKMNFMEKVIVKMVAKVSSDQSNLLPDRIDAFSKAMNTV